MPINALTRNFISGCYRHNHGKRPTSQNADWPTFLTHTHLNRYRDQLSDPGGSLAS